VTVGQINEYVDSSLEYIVDRYIFAGTRMYLVVAGDWLLDGCS
jgi:hypothetical protein